MTELEYLNRSQQTVGDGSVSVALETTAYVRTLIQPPRTVASEGWSRPEPMRQAMDAKNESQKRGFAKALWRIEIMGKYQM